MKTSCTLASWSNAHLGRGLCLEWSATCPASLSFWYWVTIFNHIHTHTQVNQRKILPWTDTAEGILHFLHCPLPIWLSVTFHLSPEWRVQTPSANNIESIPRASHCSQPRAGVRSSCSAGVGGSPLSKCRSLSLTRCPPTPAPHSPGITATQAAAFLQAPHARAPRPPPTTGGVLPYALRESSFICRRSACPLLWAHVVHLLGPKLSLPFLSCSASQ